jgi:H+-transporting ATPase
VHTESWRTHSPQRSATHAARLLAVVSERSPTPACDPPCKSQATPAGLSSSEAASRLARFGPNKLPETSVNPLLRFLGYREC